MALRLICAPDDDGRRLDRILRKALPQLPLSSLHRLLRKGKVLLDNKKALPDYRVKTGQVIEVHNLVPNLQNPLENSYYIEETSHFINNEHQNLSIIYEGEGILVLNKPSGIAVHGPKSLAQEVSAYLAPKLPPSLSFKPGPLHRLDKATSGLIMFSSSLKGARFFSEMHKNHKIKKQYLAIVDGILKKDEIWEDYISGDKKSITKVNVLKTAKNHSLILAEIEAGKKHQIRKQAHMHRHPLSGDKKYGGSWLKEHSFFLHAFRLELCSQALGDLSAMPELPEDMPKEFTAPLPAYFEEKVRELFGEPFSKQLTQRR